MHHATPDWASLSGPHHQPGHTQGVLLTWLQGPVPSAGGCTSKTHCACFHDCLPRCRSPSPHQTDPVMWDAKRARQLWRNLSVCRQTISRHSLTNWHERRAHLLARWALVPVRLRLPAVWLCPTRGAFSGCMVCGHCDRPALLSWGAVQTCSCGWGELRGVGSAAWPICLGCGFASCGPRFQEPGGVVSCCTASGAAVAGACVSGLQGQSQRGSQHHRRRANHNEFTAVRACVCWCACVLQALRTKAGNLKQVCLCTHKGALAYVGVVIWDLACAARRVVCMVVVFGGSLCIPHGQGGTVAVA